MQIKNICSPAIIPITPGIFIQNIYIFYLRYGRKWFPEEFIREESPEPWGEEGAGSLGVSWMGLVPSNLADSTVIFEALDIDWCFVFD